MKDHKMQKNTENKDRNKPQHMDTTYTPPAMTNSHFFDQQSMDNCKAFFVLHCKYPNLDTQMFITGLAQYLQ